MKQATTFDRATTLSPTDTLMREVMRVMALHQGQEISKATKRGLERNAANGYCNGLPPLGYEKTANKGLFKPTELGDFLGDVLAAFATGRITFRMARIALEHITGHLGSPGLKNARTTKILSNPYYAGLITWHGKQYLGLHKPLITVEQHADITAKLKARQSAVAQAA